MRRLPLILLTLVLLAAACGDDDVTTSGGGSTTSTLAGVPATVAGGDEAASSTPGQGGGGAGSTVPGAPSPSSSSLPTADQPTPPPATGAVGTYAGFYLRPAESASILVDVYAQEGAGPGQPTIDHAVAVLAQVSGKQIATRVSRIDGGAHQWTADDIRALGDAHGDPQSRETAVLRLFFLRGGFAEGDTAVGVAVRSDIAAVFGDRVSESAGLLGNLDAVEDAVTIHELGHLLGLVDLVLDTGRDDPEHPGHSANQGSVMYYAVESTLLGTILEGGPPRDFDQDDLGDLARIRGN